MSGDRAACREAVALIPQIVTAEVKIGLGRNCAISLSQSRSHSLIYERIARAVEKFKENPPKPLTIDEPYEIEIKYFQTDWADTAEAAGGLRVDSLRVRFVSENLRQLLYRH